MKSQKNRLENYSLKRALYRFFHLVSIESKEITSVYFFAVVSGFILLSLPLGIQAITNLLFAGTVSTSLVVLIGIVILGVLLDGILHIAQMRIIERMQQRIFARLTFAYAYRIPKISLLSIDEYYLPELVNRFFDTSNLQKGFSKLLLDFPAATIQIFFGLILLCFYHPVFIVFALLIITIVLLIFYFTSAKGFQTSMHESDYKYDVANWLEEISRAIKTFKFNQQHNLHLDKTDKLVNGYLESRDAHFKVLLLQYRVMIAFKVLITATMLILGTLLFIDQQINLGQFVAAEIIIITILNSVEKMILSLEVVYDVLTALEKLYKVLDKPQEEDSDPDVYSQVSLANSIDIKLDNVSFGYTNDKKVFEHATLHVSAGEKVCLMGSEGSGKSTLLMILAGIYHDFSGNILLNEVPINMISRVELSNKVALFLADEELFSGTLQENLTIGNKSISLADLNEICTIVGLNDYIRSQQNGYQSFLDPQGRKLSYNIVQKILLARCLVIKPSLLLLEDDWSGIEASVRERVINYLTDESQDFTMIVVTNNEDFASRCSRIIHFTKGSVNTANSAE